MGKKLHAILMDDFTEETQPGIFLACLPAGVLPCAASGAGESFRCLIEEAPDRVQGRGTESVTIAARPTS